MSDSNTKVGIIDLGINNIQSIQNAYKQINSKVNIISKKENLLKYEVIILPGVGSFNHGIRNLKKLKIEKELQKFLKIKTNKLMEYA